MSNKFDPYSLQHLAIRMRYGKKMTVGDFGIILESPTLRELHFFDIVGEWDLGWIYLIEIKTNSGITIWEKTNSESLFLLKDLIKDMDLKNRLELKKLVQSFKEEYDELFQSDKFQTRLLSKMSGFLFYSIKHVWPNRLASISSPLDVPMEAIQILNAIGSGEIVMEVSKIAVSGGLKKEDIYRIYYTLIGTKDPSDYLRERLSNANKSK